ncbi:MAG: aminopeptidase P family protein [Prolixibacteraceae bacterium]|nr:aminopeptidase P family protein [Prolixibacteraceae bacterium]MBN2774383.1 aminopeptidase P family protein [Prolixibacteraceae bacterium]
MTEIKTRINRLREVLKQKGLDAYYISGTDPHVSEYLPARWKTREFISGFTGSFGEVVITQEEAFLWTDTRYFLQAEDQLKGSGIKMQKLRVPEAIPVDEWLAANLNPGQKVGINPECLPYNTYKALVKRLEDKSVKIILCNDLLDIIWENRPLIPEEKVFELDLKYAGRSRNEKFSDISEKLKLHGADFQVITALDDLAWTFNLRGSDVNYNPVFVGFGLVGEESKILFINQEKLPIEIKEKLVDEGVDIKPYSDFYSFLKDISAKRVLIDPVSTNLAIVNSLAVNNEIIESSSIPGLLKALKNETELNGFRSAMKKDGVALVKFLFWLQNNIGEIALTEYDIGRKLAEFRAENEGFRGESFTPIVGYRDHGAIVHLSVGKENANTLEPEGILLFDSGGHYREGTTDITRTVALGPVTKQQKTDFTIVLKGMISLTQAIFPEGTKGIHLDILARKPLWENGMNYGHGTGHGVGHYLAVHEGPMAIRQEYNPNSIVPGMVMSNEPAFYRKGEYGLRTENMIACVNKGESEYGQFYGFETLSLCPIDIQLIESGLLDEKEISWLNNYHKKVRQELSPLLDEKHCRFLEKITPEVM